MILSAICTRTAPYYLLIKPEVCGLLFSLFDLEFANEDLVSGSVLELITGQQTYGRRPLKSQKGGSNSLFS